MTLKTPLFDQHAAAGARIVDFGGWDMPLHYGSQIEEHHVVRRDAGAFDVSHMTVVDVQGPGARAWLRRLLANDVARLQVEGKALYTCMLNPDGGVIDDLIVYYRSPDDYRLVLNAATREKDLAWLDSQGADVEDVDVIERPELAMLAIQGPNAIARVGSLLTAEDARHLRELAAFHAFEAGELFIARTGYTGEDGVEIILDGGQASGLWRALVAAGVRPVGLGARDTLRLEAGMALYGTDMDETVTPLESGLGWTVAWTPPDRDFIGRGALERQRDEGEGRRMVGLLLLGKGVLRGHQAVRFPGGQGGEITSGSFSPTLGRSIALARVDGGYQGDACEVEIRGNWQPARVVKYPFVRHGKSCLSEEHTA